MFERICRENGIVARNTKPRSPTTTGKVERFHQTLQGDLLHTPQTWTDLDTAQALIDRFRTEYNTDRPHQSLDMAFPADRFTARTADALPLRLPSVLSAAAIPSPRTPSMVDTIDPQAVAGTMAEADRVDLAIEIGRTVPTSGNLGIGGHQFWLGPVSPQAGAEVTLWIDCTVVHLLHDGVRLKTVPSRFSPAQLRQLLDAGGRPAGPSPLTPGPARTGRPIEVDRTVTGSGLVGLGGQRIPIGYQFAGQRVTLRMHGTLLQIIQAGTLLRSLPNPFGPADLSHIRDARPARPAPQPAPEPVRVERRVSSRGGLVIAGQRIHLGIAHAGRTITIEARKESCR